MKNRGAFQFFIPIQEKQRDFPIFHPNLWKTDRLPNFIPIHELGKTSSNSEQFYLTLLHEPQILLKMQKKVGAGGWCQKITRSKIYFFLDNFILSSSVEEPGLLYIRRRLDIFYLCGNTLRGIEKILLPFNCWSLADWQKTCAKICEKLS